MLRILSFLLLGVLVTPAATAVAVPVSISVAVGPPGEDGYYVAVQAFSPEAPRASTEATDDCASPAHGDERPDARPAAHVERFLAWDPLAQPRVSSWFPQCVTTGIDGPAQASYNVTTGRYYVALSTPESVGGTTPMRAAAGLEFTGSTGVGILTDCEECPPPI